MSSHRFLGYGRQSINESDLQAVCDVLKSDFLTQGPAVSAFEQDLAAYVGTKYAVAVSSATAALHIACLATGMETGDIGVTQPLTFVASANCMAYCGAQVHLVDIHPDSLEMDPAGLKTFLRAHPDCKTIIPVAYGGLSSHGEEIRALAGERIIIEDASHALGGHEPGGAKVGACTYSDMCVFSFHPVKPLTTGEGGAITTNSKELYEKLLTLRSHGIVRGSDLVENTQEADNPWYYEQQSLGFNYRLSDILAALGRSQIERLDGFIARRREIARYYDFAFAGLPHLKLVQSSREQRARSGHHLYVVRIDYAALSVSRKQVMHALQQLGIGTQVHYIPVHKHPYYRQRISQGQQAFPVSNQFFDECLTIPCFPELQNQDLDRVISAISNIVKTGNSGNTGT